MSFLSLSDFSAAGLLILALFSPLFLALGLLFKPTKKISYALSFFAALPAILLSFVHLPFEVFFETMLLGSKFVLDKSNLLFWIVASYLWFFATWFSQVYFKKHERKTEFMFYFLLAMSGNFTLILAADIASFYFSFALMSFLSYGLIVFDRSEPAKAAGKVYIIMVVLGELALITAMIMLAQISGSTELEQVHAFIGANPSSLALITVCLFIGFGIKAGLIPLHVWLPLAHPVAPTPASAVLSGVMIKAGLIGWLKFLPIYEGVPWLKVFGMALMSFGIFSAVYGVILGLSQKKLKAILAYSSISQMGFPLMGLGMLFYYPDKRAGIVAVISIYVLHHGLSKGALFFSTAIVQYTKTASRAINSLIIAGLLLPVISVSGFPLSSGALAKSFLKKKMYAFESIMGDGFFILLTLTAAGTSLLLIKFFLLSLDEFKQASPEKANKKALLLPWALLLIATLALPFLYSNVSFEDYFYKTLSWKALWPFLLGTALALLLFYKKDLRSKTFLPAGDVLVFFRQVTLFLSQCVYDYLPVLRYIPKTLNSVIDKQGGKVAEKVSFWREKLMQKRASDLLIMSLLIGFILLIAKVLV